MQLLLRRKLAASIILFAIVLVGFSLRLHNLGKHDFWFDEVITHDYVSKEYSWSSQDFINNFIEKNPPLYFILLREWSVVFGKTEFSLRFLSLILGVLSIFLIYKLSRLFFGSNSSLLAAVFLCLSPFQIWYSQESRGFTLSLALSLLNSYFFLKSMREGGVKYGIGYSFSLALLLFTTYYGLFLLVPQALLQVIYNRKGILKWTISLLPPVLLFMLFILPVFAHQLAVIRDKNWLSPPPNATAILDTLNNFVIGYNASQIIYTIMPLFITGVCVFALFGIPSGAMVALLLLGLLPVILIFAFSKAFFPFYIDRHLIIFSPFFYILLSGGITSIKIRWIKFLTIFVFIGCAAFSLFNYNYDILPQRPANETIFLKKPVRPIIEIFLQNKRKGDIIGFSNYGFMNTFRHYLEAGSKEYPEIQKLYFFIPGGDEFFEFLIRNMKSGGFKNEIKFVNLENGDLGGFIDRRIWLFSSSWKRHGSLEPYARRVKSWFDEHCLKLREWYYDGVWIGIYKLTKQ